MSKRNFFVNLLVIIVTLLLSIPAVAQQPADNSGNGGSAANTQGNTFFNNLLNTVGAVLNEKLQDEFDRWLGKYEGKIEQVRLIEQTPDSIVLEVTYRGIKQQDGVSARGEVLRGGMVLPGFSSTLGQVQGKSGIARLTITRTAGSGWDASAPATETSDQIRLYLVRSDYPDRHFGELVYDFPKTWGEDAYGVEAGSENGEAIELGDDTGQENQPATTITPVIRPGTILLPSTVKPAQTGNTGSQAPVSVQQPKIPANTVVSQVTSYDLFQNASKARWRSSRSTLTYPGNPNDSRGFARGIARGRVTNRGMTALNILETHPAWSDNGWIEGRYPALLLGPRVHFLATASFLQGATGSNGAIFKVYVYSPNDNKMRRVFARRVNPSDTRHIDVDLSRWAGKSVELILRVDAGGNSARDWAVWIKPRLEQK